MAAAMATVVGVPSLAASRTCRAQRPIAIQATCLRASPLSCSAASPQKILLASPCRRSSTAMQAMPIAEVAGEFAEITGVATVMFAITLVGLAVGFILLRFEALVEEGKLDDVLK